MTLFPERSQDSIRSQARRMALVGKDKVGKRKRGSAYFYTQDEDDLIRKYYAGELSLEEVSVLTGRTTDGIRQRAKALGLDRCQSQATWEWMKALYEARFIKGMRTAESVHEAGREVLQKRRGRGESTHPFYWGAFVAAGDWE